VGLGELGQVGLSEGCVSIVGRRCGSSWCFWCRIVLLFSPAFPGEGVLVIGG